VSRLDRWLELSARELARSAGRRSFLARAGRVLLGAAGVAAFPVLPVARADGGSSSGRGALPEDVDGPEGDPRKCDYWRYCAIDGFLCTCCGGSATACPPGSELSPVTWVGTCRNPADGKDYLISYNDCCGKGFCGRCVCNRNEGDRPDYHWYRSNDINWCAGTSSQAYHCSIAVVIRQATQQQPER
jgi:methylamine dehydrogenase light chain